MKAARKILGNFWFIHAMVLLGLLALWGFVEQGNECVLLGVYMSFSGAMCGAFITVVDAIRTKK